MVSEGRCDRPRAAARTEPLETGSPFCLRTGNGSPVRRLSSTEPPPLETTPSACSASPARAMYVMPGVSWSTGIVPPPGTSTVGGGAESEARRRPAEKECGSCGLRVSGGPGSSQQPAASRQQAAGSRQQAAACLLPAASSQQPAASSQQPAASSQQPAASSQQLRFKEGSGLESLHGHGRSARWRAA
jgi:hypothetical protein